MANKITIQNNVDNLYKDSFKQQTGKDAKSNPELYYQYCQARSLDMISQVSIHFLNDMAEVLDLLRKR